MGQGWFNPAGSKPALLHPLTLAGGARETCCSCRGGASEEHLSGSCWALWHQAAAVPRHLPLLPRSAAPGDDVCRDNPQGKPPLWHCSPDTAGAETEVLLFVLCVSGTSPQLASVAMEESEGQTSSPAASSLPKAALGQTRGKSKVVPSYSHHDGQQAECCCTLHCLPCPQSLKGVK